MKKVLSVAVCKNNGVELPPCQETEILYAEDSEKGLFELIKQIKSKYTVLVDSDFTCGAVDGFLKELDDATADIIIFDGGYLFKTAVLKNLTAKQCIDRYSAEIFGAFNAKTVANVNLKPFYFSAVKSGYSDEIAARLSDALDEFKRSKSRLNKDVYSFLFDILCARLETFYMSAMLSIRAKTLEAEALKEFDLKLKDNIVLYLALEKRFTAADLKKLRNNDFKINFIQANKFKKSVKI